MEPNHRPAEVVEVVEVAGWTPVGAVMGLLAVSNVMTNRVLPGWAYVPWSLAMSSIVFVIAVRVDRLGPGTLGLSRATVRRGLTVGGLVVALLVVVYLIALALPAARDLFDDARVGEVSAVGMVYQVVIRIPLGTVVLEELAFRGVLLGMFLVRMSTVRAVLASSVLFGLWHVLPAMGIEETNPVLEDLSGGAGGAAVAVVLAVLGTAVAGIVLAWLRLFARHLLAPVVVHIGTNSLGFFVSWWYFRLN